jgi:hypothetical protein
MLSLFLLLVQPVRSEPTSPEQRLVFDLSINGTPVGSREITINYLPISDSASGFSRANLGSRLLESRTEVDAVVAGKEIRFREHSTAQFSGVNSRFVSSISFGDDVAELQGRRLKDGSWMVYDVQASEVLRRDYRRSEMDFFSLALFDPGQAHEWKREEPLKIMLIETGLIWGGSWAPLGSETLRSPSGKISGDRMEFQSGSNSMDALWSPDGLLVDWSVTVSGVRIDANIRSIPETPQFGEIESIQSFSGVSEEEL